MLSIFQLSLGILIGIGLGGWWVVSSLNRDDLEKQLKLVFHALDGSQAYWSAKLADPTVNAYAEHTLIQLAVERNEALDMHHTLTIGERLTAKQLIRLDKLVSKHLAALVALSHVQNRG